jgi:hypothetical protein
MVHGLATESRRLLIEELLFGDQVAEPVPSVPWESMRDNPTDERPGLNFLKDHRTRGRTREARVGIGAGAGIEINTQVVTGFSLDIDVRIDTVTEAITCRRA